MANRRYLAIGFDDFRRSDFSMVFPLFNKYGATATYNRITYGHWSQTDNALLDILIQTGNEIGDHTWFHCNYMFNDPLCNGQDPHNPEGDQTIFPSNEQLRDDRGDGRNVFDFRLDESVKKGISNWWLYHHEWTYFDALWGNLNDEQCQLMRDHFSIYKDTSGMLDVFDALSNKYLGTVGKSRGSWDNDKACYAGGIFTGSKTSCNHEIWERVLKVTKLFYQEAYSTDFAFKTWSWPGSVPSPFNFTNRGGRYYDEQCTKPYNYCAKFPSSITHKLRSWTQALREAGYRIAHDTIYPSRNDGLPLCMMSKQFIYNAGLSRQDALLYRTNNSISYSQIAGEYSREFFNNASFKSIPAQMYDAGGAFYTFIEAIRHNTSNGMIHGEVIDSVASYSEKCFLTQMLEYCKTAGVEVVSKSKAYGVCFNEYNDSGNLVYNPTFRNTAKEFMPDAEKIPSNPDGYIGDCAVVNGEILIIRGETYYLHYGIPNGEIVYSAEIEGTGRIYVYAIKNSDAVGLNNNDLDLLAAVNIASGFFERYAIKFEVPNNPVAEYEPVCEGYGNKVMGLKIVYFGSLRIKNIYIGRKI